MDVATDDEPIAGLPSPSKSQQEMDKKSMTIRSVSSSLLSTSVQGLRRIFITDTGEGRKNVITSYSVTKETPENEQKLPSMNITQSKVLTINPQKNIIVLTEGSNGIAFYDANSPQTTIQTISFTSEHGKAENAWCVSWSDDSKYIAVGLDGGKVAMVIPDENSVGRFKIDRSVAKHTAEVRGVAFSLSLIHI